MKDAYYRGENAIELPGAFAEIPAKLIPYTSGSDYSGDIVTRANYLYLIREWADKNGIYDVSGGYGTYTIAYIPEECDAETLEEIEELCERLKAYPVIDEDFLSEKESEMVNETMEEFKKTFSDKFPFFDIQKFEEAAFEYFYGCSKTSFSVDYSETDAIKEIQKSVQGETAIKHVRRIIEENGIEFSDIESCLDYSPVGSIASMEYDAIAKALKNAFPLEYQIQAIVEKLQE